MSHPTGPDALTDPIALRAGDRSGLLPALATAGAQLRSVGEQLSAARFERPRSMIVVDPADTGDGELVAAVLERPRAPVVAARDLPDWAGALDLVVVLASALDDMVAARAAAEASRRGASVLVRGAQDGPVADAAGDALLAPRIAVPELAAGPGRLAVLLGVAGAAGMGGPAGGDAVRAGPTDEAREPGRGHGTWRPGSGDETLGAAPAGEARAGPGNETSAFGRAARALDAAALACGPGAEPFVNPAVALALRLIDGAGLFIAEDPVGMAVARRCARAVRLLGGRPAAAQHVSGLMPGGQLTAALTRADDPFADPEADGPQAAVGLVPVLVPPPGGARAPGGRMAVLERSIPRAVTLRSDEPGDPAVDALVLSLRVEFAAAYLGIAAGQVVPPDGPDGLGPSGGARDARPATTVDEVDSDDWDDRDGRRWS